MSGGETDVCVLATVMSAIDLGYRIVLATDALCSVSDRTHDALMTLYGERFSQQLAMATTVGILEAWYSGKRAQPTFAIHLGSKLNKSVDEGIA